MATSASSAAARTAARCLKTMRRRTAVVTGSTSGIGLGIADRLAVTGFNIMLNGFGEEEEITRTRTALEARYPDVKVGYSGADMSKAPEIKQLIETTVEELGGVDVVVNNAGIQLVSPIEEFPEDTYEKIIAINMSAAFYTAKYAIPFMKQHGFGRIINIASAHGKVASPFKSAYTTAKHGVVGLTKAIAVECGPDGITANAVCPGYVKTELVEKQIANTAKARGITEEEVISTVMLGSHPTGKFVGVDEIGALVAYLSSNEARSCNGSIMEIDGGWTSH